ncbi:MAG: hypothetical protein CMH54_04185 [Myxococcales bacterium]|nr:hypothetical protein [Myxococcales bacterium]|tara:strand:- start:629 stop:1051 length:423 start_codon:yes stop_codon:yes gene_type:complete
MTTNNPNDLTMAQVRGFGIVMAVVFSAIACFGVWRDSFVWTDLRLVLLGCAGVFLLFALVRPQLLARPARAWLAFGEVLGSIVTGILLTVFFFSLFTAVSLLRRLFDKDSMGLKWERKKDSYWRKRGSDNRGRERYKHMF